MEQKNTMEEFFDEEIGNYHDKSKVILRIKHLMPGSRVLFSSFIFLGFFLGPQIASATTNQLILFEKNKNELSLIPMKAVALTSLKKKVTTISTIKNEKNFHFVSQLMATKISQKISKELILISGGAFISIIQEEMTKEKNFEKKTYTNKVVNVYKKIQDIGIRIKTTVSNHPKKTVAILLSSLMVICLLVSSFNIANENIELKIILDEVFALLKRKEKISMLELSTCMEKMNRLMEICKKE